MAHKPDERHWRGWYKLARWERMREAQRNAHPLCAYCIEDEIVTEADVVDHIKPHKGDPELFWDPDNLQSLCKACHDGRKQREEIGHVHVRFGPDGWPL